MNLYYRYNNKAESFYLRLINVFTLGNADFKHVYTAEMAECRAATMAEF